MRRLHQQNFTARVALPEPIREWTLVYIPIGSRTMFFCFTVNLGTNNVGFILVLVQHNFTRLAFRHNTIVKKSVLSLCCNNKTMILNPTKDILKDQEAEHRNVLFARRITRFEPSSVSLVYDDGWGIEGTMQMHSSCPSWLPSAVKSVTTCMRDNDAGIPSSGCRSRNESRRLLPHLPNKTDEALLRSLGTIPIIPVDVLCFFCCPFVKPGRLPPHLIICSPVWAWTNNLRFTFQGSIKY